MKLKDISQSTDLYEIAEVIQQLNPNAEIRVSNMYYDKLYSSIPAEQLVLPEGFYLNDKNGITNKHNTQSGVYCSLSVENLSMAHKNTLMPKVQKIVKIEHPTTKQELEQVKQNIVSANNKLKNKVESKKVDLNVKYR